MKINQVILAVVVAIVVIGGGFLLFHKSSPSYNTTSSSHMANMPTSNTSSSSAQVTNQVSISNYAFSPISITIKKGTTVTWTNHDSVAHTVVETDGKTGPNSQPINDGKTFSFTYNSTGTFAYHCSIHPEMLGSVTVTD